MLKRNYKFTILMAVAASFLFIAIPATSTEKTGDIKHEEVAASDNKAINAARLNLKNAIDSYRAGDMAATRHNLETAISSLKQAAQENTSKKTREESRKLGVKIDEFKEMLIQESKQDENSLLRFWHQATSIVKREADNLIHSYVELSVSEKTLKYLLDAKMHLFRAQHDLLISHDNDDAASELDNVLGYLDEASQVSKPSLQKKITDLSKEIQTLKDHIKQGNESWRENDLILTLEQAVKNLNKAKSSASPQISERIESLETEIQILQVDIERTNVKNEYEAAMEKLKEIIHQL